MKKIPTLFKREFEGHKIIGISSELSDPSFRWVLDGEGDATLKFDGSCCAIFDGKFYRRYDAKKGKVPPEGAIPCEDNPDPVTGHWPHWVLVDENKPEDKWFIEAYMNTNVYSEGTFEAVGKHFNGNPYNVDYDRLVRHGGCVLKVTRSFEGIKEFLKNNSIEGIVFWKDGEPRCKIKRSDFGFKWPVDFPHNTYLFDLKGYNYV